jgi:hypothetical protein
MLDLIKSSGFQISPENLEQLLFYNLTDVNFKTMNQFEPSKAFAAEMLKQPLQRVGEHPSYISDEEFAENSDS